MNVVLGLVLVCACGLLYLLYEVIKQQGRLLRLDGIKERLGMRPLPQPAGLAVAAAFAPSKLPHLTGKEVALEDTHHVEDDGSRSGNLRIKLKVLASAAVAVMFCSVVPAMAGVNLITNGGFEDGNLTGWATDYTDELGNPLASTPTYAAYAKHAARNDDRRRRRHRDVEHLRWPGPLRDQ